MRAMAVGLMGALGLATAVQAADMPAYVINEIHVTDAAKYKVYADQATATVKAFGGEYIVRGGNPASLAGAVPADRIVVMKFPSRGAAVAWHASAAYQKVLPIREASSTSVVYVVDGTAPQ